jgi:hypothetical protein
LSACHIAFKKQRNVPTPTACNENGPGNEHD